MLQKVLSVAKPGAFGRNMIKNTENVLVSNIRAVYKPNAVYQLLASGDGFAV